MLLGPLELTVQSRHPVLQQAAGRRHKTNVSMGNTTTVSASFHGRKGLKYLVVFMRLPCEQGDTVVGGHTSQHADAGQLVREQLSVVFLQLVDLLLVVRRYAVH